jgi:hypothetical protein
MVSDPTLASVFQTLSGASFIVNGATPAKNSAWASAGTEVRIANGITLLASSTASSPRIRPPTLAPAQCDTRDRQRPLGQVPANRLLQSISDAPFVRFGS